MRVVLVGRVSARRARGPAHVKVGRGPEGPVHSWAEGPRALVPVVVSPTSVMWSASVVLLVGIAAVRGCELCVTVADPCYTGLTL